VSLAIYIVKRLALAATVVVLSMVFLAMLVHLVPGDPVKIILGPRAPEALSAVIRKQMELDLPVHIQVWHFVERGVQGDLGVDFLSHVSVTSIIDNALPHTILLVSFSLLLAALGGIPLGVYAASHPNSWTDRIVGWFSVALITVPAFVAALFLLLVFSVRLDWLPAIGAGSTSDPVDYLKHLILPAAALALGWVGYLGRLVRTSMLEVLGSNYIRTAQAYGLRRRLIFYRYALKNALIPTIAVLGAGFGNLIGSAVFVEVIFDRPGLGSLLVQSIEVRNYPVVRGAVLAIVVLTVLANLLADLSYRLLDPRIRLDIKAR
jgi:peptide/nickel transport system permease protein